MPDAAWSLYERQIHAARGWLRDCDWADADEDHIAGVDPHTVMSAVARHYEGGWERFLIDSDLAGNRPRVAS